MEFVNLTPHTLVVYDKDSKHVIRKIPPSGTIARVSTRKEQLEPVDGIPVSRTVFGDVEGIPEPREDTLYVVSSIVASHTSRDDVVAPDTSDDSVVRNEEGQIIGVRAFQKF